jgi:hypothetical protein
MHHRWFALHDERKKLSVTFGWWRDMANLDLMPSSKRKNWSSIDEDEQIHHDIY